MRQTIKIFLLIVLTLITLSCKKEPKLHELRYTVDFIQVPDYGYTNYLEVLISPFYMTEYNYDSDYPRITPDFAKKNKHWVYDYWELKDGDRVQFSLLASDGYYFTMKVFIDGVEVSQMTKYGSNKSDDMSGLGVTSGSGIDFIYYE